VRPEGERYSVAVIDVNANDYANRGTQTIMSRWASRSHRVGSWLQPELRHFTRVGHIGRTLLLHRATGRRLEGLEVYWAVGQDGDR
jgi:hypothetical protein